LVKYAEGGSVDLEGNVDSLVNWLLGGKKPDERSWRLSRWREALKTLKTWASFEELEVKVEQVVRGQPARRNRGLRSAALRERLREIGVSEAAIDLVGGVRWQWNAPIRMTRLIVAKHHGVTRKQVERGVLSLRRYHNLRSRASSKRYRSHLRRTARLAYQNADWRGHVAHAARPAAPTTTVAALALALSGIRERVELVREATSASPGRRKKT
jgi:hypothetical protein